jgi:hypothetical protein
MLLTRYGLRSAAVGLPRTNAADDRTLVLKRGLLFGLMLGSFFLALAPFGNVVPLPKALEKIVDALFAPVVLGVTLILLVATGFGARRVTDHQRVATLAGLLAGVVGFALCGLSFIVVDMVFFDTVRHQPEKIFNFRHSGYLDMRTYLFDTTVRGALIITPVGGGVGAVLGSIGGFLARRKSPAMTAPSESL